MKKLLIEIFDPTNKRNNIMTLVTYPDYDKVVYFYVGAIDKDEKWHLQHFIKKHISRDISVEFIDNVNITNIHKILDDICVEFDYIRAELWGGLAVLGVTIAGYCYMHNIEIISLDEKFDYLYKINKSDIIKEKIDLKYLNLSQSVELNGGRIIESRPFLIKENNYGNFGELCRLCIKYGSLWDVLSKDFANACENKSLNFDLGKIYRVNGLNEGVIKKIIAGKKGGRQKLVYRILELIRACDLFTVKYKGERMTAQFVSEDAKLLCVQKGFILEEYIYWIAKCSNIFDEIMMGLKIDWISKDFMPGLVSNEIDVALRKNNINIFISCKMTRGITTATINELEIYANKFLGDDNIKIIATNVDIGQGSIDRCRECDILVYNTDDNSVDFIELLKDELRIRGISV